MLIENIKNRWLTSTASAKCFFLANCSLVIMLPVLLATGANFPVWIGGPTLVFLFVGFAIWAVPKGIAIGRSRTGVAVLLCLQAVMIPLCLAAARNIVADALHLPPQSFDVTVALLTVLLIPVAWSALIILLIVIASLVLALAAMLIVFAISFFRLSSIFVLPLATLSDRLRVWCVALHSYQTMTVAHMMGALVAALVVCGLLAGYGALVFDRATIRFAAYILDFSVAKDYPGIRHGEPMRLLENGVVVYAKRDGIEITFEVDYFVK